MDLLPKLGVRRLRLVITGLMLGVVLLLFLAAFAWVQTGPWHAFWKTLGVAFLALFIRDLLDLALSSREEQEREALAQRLGLSFGGAIDDEEEFQWLYYRTRTRDLKPVWLAVRLTWERLANRAHLRARVELDEPGAPEAEDDPKPYSVFLLKLRKSLMLVIHEEYRSEKEMTAIMHFPRAGVKDKQYLPGVISHNDWHGSPCIHAAILCKRPISGLNGRELKTIGRLSDEDSFLEGHWRSMAPWIISLPIDIQR